MIGVAPSCKLALPYLCDWVGFAISFRYGVCLRASEFLEIYRSSGSFSKLASSESSRRVFHLPPCRGKPPYGQATCGSCEGEHVRLRGNNERFRSRLRSCLPSIIGKRFEIDRSGSASATSNGVLFKVKAFSRCETRKVSGAATPIKRNLSRLHLDDVSLLLLSPPPPPPRAAVPFIGFFRRY